MKFYKDQPGVWCLNRGWKFKETDCKDLPCGIRHDDIYDYTKAGGAKGPAELSFDDSDWKPVSLPHDWVTGKSFDAQEMCIRDRFCNVFQFLVLQYPGTDSGSFTGRQMYGNISLKREPDGEYRCV